MMTWRYPDEVTFCDGKCFIGVSDVYERAAIHRKDGNEETAKWLLECAAGQTFFHYGARALHISGYSQLLALPTTTGAAN
jgi:hypothetical protein